MFLADTLRTELPRQLQKRLTIMVTPYRDGGGRSPLFSKTRMATPWSLKLIPRPG